MTKRNLPKYDLIWEQIFVDDNVFLITSDITRVKYTMWQKVDAGYLLMGTGQTPTKLKEKFKNELS